MNHDLLQKMNYVGQGALHQWGHRAQAIKTIEECGELITQLSKRLNGSPTPDAKIVDEVADVLFMVMQMRSLFGEYAVDERLNYKLDRTRAALERMKDLPPSTEKISQRHADYCDVENGKWRKSLRPGEEGRMCGDCAAKLHQLSPMGINSP